MRAAITRLSKMVGELKRRNVFRVGSLYLMTIWVLSLGAADLFPAFGVPDWGVRFLVITLVLGFPVAIVLAWAFEVRPEGVVIDPGPSPDEPTMLITRGRPHLCISWTEAGRTVTRWFNNNLTIGRDPASEICMADKSVSREHARIIYIDNTWTIEDLHSRNGTLLDGALIDRIPLPAHAEIQLSDDGPTISIENTDPSLIETAAIPRLKSA